MGFKKTNLFLISALSFLPLLAHADLIPSGNNIFYYRIGGGEDVPMPANISSTSIPLDADNNIGLNYNCGVFNPQLSITNSLNAIENSFQNVSQMVVNNATSAITEFPMYILARANPTLYDLFNNGLLGARTDLDVSTKSCEVMQGEIGQGKNPYTDWATVSAGDDWKYHMGVSSNSHGNQDGDINQIKSSVAQDNGTQGVPWVQGTNTGRGDTYAGGEGQPPVYVIHDTAVAGYNVILQSDRNYNDTSPPIKTPANAQLVGTWSDPNQAAHWITNVIGDEKITTFPGGDKQSTPGLGLLPAMQQLSQQVSQNLVQLISGQQEITLANLQAVSAPGVMINASVIDKLRQQPPVTQAILVNKLGQEVATAKVIDQALLARQILQEGSQVPAIYGNKAAQNDIQLGIARLNQGIHDLLFNVQVRKEMSSNTITELMSSTQAQEMDHATVQIAPSSGPELQNGAVPSANNDARNRP